MRKGFIFNPGRCVNCNSCSAACRLYNGWDLSMRNVYTSNEKVLPGIPLLNVSLACNHCENPACLKGCPSGAFYRDDNTSAVLIDREKCLGCRYCQWNCPYDAPKYDEKENLISKCNLCHDAVSAGNLPSCSTACPTGALSFGELKGGDDIRWFPRGSLKPALVFAGNTAPEALNVSPAHLFGSEEVNSHEEYTRPDWSLVLFSFLAILSVATQVASFARGIFPGNMLFMQIAFAAVISLFHPGKPLRAIMSVRNIRHSPLSREILFFLLFAIFSFAASAIQMAEIAAAASVSGLILLVMIDSVYAVPDRKVLLHSGQTFLSGLLLISYFTNSLVPFTFIVLLKTGLSVRLLVKSEYKGKFQAVRFFRSAVLLIAWAGLISGFAQQGFTVSLLVISAEFIDRILFYTDFEPENIKRNISKNINSLLYEKERG